MGGLFSKFRSEKVETIEDWEKQMEKCKLSVHTYDLREQKYKRSEKYSTWFFYGFAAISSIISLSVAYFHPSFLKCVYAWLILASLNVIFWVCSLAFRFLVERNAELSKQAEQEKTYLVDKLYNINTTVNDLTRVLKKYNLENRLINNPIQKEYQSDITKLCKTVEQLLSLPLCTICKDYQMQERQKILKQLPAKYMTRFSSIQPREYLNKCLLMSFLNPDYTNQPSMSYSPMYYYASPNNNYPYSTNYGSPVPSYPMTNIPSLPSIIGPSSASLSTVSQTQIENGETVDTSKDQSHESSELPANTVKETIADTNNNSQEETQTLDSKPKETVSDVSEEKDTIKNESELSKEPEVISLEEEKTSQLRKRGKN
ncbi:hypothetical protein WA158_000516 [Blastocystis sp. Blastoise]